MAVVTGYTAGYLQGVLDATVVTGSIDGSGHLILTTKDGTPIDVGSIAGAVGAASLTASGVVELATTAETTAGTDATRAVTPAGMATIISSKQPADDDLTAIANITPTNDDFIQRKSGVWVARSMAQLAADLIPVSGFAATETQKGIVELATTAEVATGTDTTRAITAAGLAALVASATTKGIVELATDAETATGTDTSRALTPANLASLIASATAKGIVELATDAEALTGTDTTRATTPANLKPIFDAKQPLDSDLTALAALAPANDDVVQRKAGAWVNRTIAQLLTDLNTLVLSGGTMTGTINGTLSATTTAMIAALVTGDTFDRVRVYANGDIEFGSGAASRDVKLTRSGANQLSLTTADFLVSTVGRGLRVAVGTNGKMQTGTLVAGTVTINNTSITANSHVIPYHMTAAGTPGWLRASKVAGTSVTITSSSSTDTSLVGYFVIEPA